jgi:hypothetical protein
MNRMHVGAIFSAATCRNVTPGGPLVITSRVAYPHCRGSRATFMFDVQWLRSSDTLSESRAMRMARCVSSSSASVSVSCVRFLAIAVDRHGADECRLVAKGDSLSTILRCWPPTRQTTWALLLEGAGRTAWSRPSRTFSSKRPYVPVSLPRLFKTHSRRILAACGGGTGGRAQAD